MIYYLEKILHHFSKSAMLFRESLSSGFFNVFVFTGCVKAGQSEN